MRAPARATWGAALVTLAIWALAAGGALYWGLRVGAGAGHSDAVPVGAAGIGLAQPDVAAVARALGALPQAAPAAAAPASPALVSRLQLRGVVTHGARGAALIAIDGKPAKPFRVGAELEDGWTVRAVARHSVEIGSGAQRATLEMPPLAERGRDGSAPALPRPGIPPAAMPPMPSPGMVVPGGQMPGQVPGLPAPQAYPAPGAPAGTQSHS